jgi:hypothetical protein
VGISCTTLLNVVYYLDSISMQAGSFQNTEVKSTVTDSRVAIIINGYVVEDI